MGDNLGQKLRERLERRDALLAPGAHNALTARIIEDIGFEAVYVTGAGISNSYLGIPDLGLLTMTELAGQVAAIRDAVTLPLIVDADTGFGNAISVGRTVKVLERSGANAIQLEDQSFPKRCGHFGSKQIISAEEMVQKIHAAVDARRDEDLLLIARTDARALLGLEAALDRASLYQEAGADVLFVEAPVSVEEMAEIPKRVSAPQVCNMVIGGMTPVLSMDALREMHYALVIYANLALQSAIHGMQGILKRLRESGSIKDVLDRITPFDERQRIVGKHHYDALEKRYIVRE